MRRTPFRMTASSASASLSDQLDIPVHLHLHETAQEVEESRRDHGVRPFARMQGLGLVNDRLIAVHMTQLTDGEIAACARGGRVGGALPGIQSETGFGFLPGGKTAARRRQSRDRHRRLRFQQRPRHVRRDCAPRRCWRKPSPTMPAPSMPPTRCARPRSTARARSGWTIASVRSNPASRPTWRRCEWIAGDPTALSSRLATGIRCIAATGQRCLDRRPSQTGGRRIVRHRCRCGTGQSRALAGTHRRIRLVRSRGKQDQP